LGASETKAQIAGDARWLAVDDALLLRSTTTTTTTTAERGIGCRTFFFWVRSLPKREK
jgi:predicted 2-oxoglutarate/Fe(II)-dependent dioxygenase YbiX